MFPLAAADVPATADDLASAIRATLAEWMSVEPASSLPERVTLDAPAYPRVARFTVNLDGACVTARDIRRPSARGYPKEHVHVDRFEISCRPLRFASGSIDVHASAAGLTLAIVEDAASGRPALAVSAISAGRVEFRVAGPDLQALALSAARLAAGRQGVGVDDVQVDLRATGQRSLEFDVRVKARKLLLTGVVRLTGTLTIGDDLRVTATDLRCTGQGVIGSMAAAVAQSKLAAVTGRPMSVVAFSPGAIVLRRLELNTDDGLSAVVEIGTHAGLEVGVTS